MVKSLVTDALRFSYNETDIFAFPDIVCEKGKHLLITGSSGCGKTTLLHLIAGLLKAQSGKILVGGVDITQLKRRALDSFRGRETGIVFQTPLFIKSLTAFENLEMAQALNHLPVNKTRIETLLEDLKISHCSNSKTTEMSQGELQRLSLARAVINSPSLILADEPTSSLDDENCKEALNLLSTQANTLGASLVIVTHDNRLIPSFPNVLRLENSKKRYYYEPYTVQYTATTLPSALFLTEYHPFCYGNNDYLPDFFNQG